MNLSDNSEYDLIIVGGGLAGASLAVALMSQLAGGVSARTAGDAGRKSGRKSSRQYRVAVVEAYAPDDDLQPSYDDRSIALSWGSRLIYQQIGVWPVLAPHAEAIKNIHISDRGHFGVTRLTAEQEGVEALGYVVENRPVGAELFRLMNEAQHGQTDPAVQLDLYCPAQLTALKQDDDRVSIELELVADRQSGQAAAQTPTTVSLQAGMLVAADGNNSRVLKLLNIGSTRQDYKQSAVITNITPGRAHANVAYERFTETGPLAMLPMRGNRCSVVWTLPPDEAACLYAMDQEAFRQRLQQAFGYRLGEIRKVGKRAVYPLFLQSASEMVHGRVAILGNAAHSVHPVAGQGFNLALRDVALLTDLIDRGCQQAGTAGGIDVTQILDEYARLRSEDIQQVYRFTDTLVKLFSNAISPLAHARSCGLLLVDLLPDIKHTLAAHSMGMSGVNLRDLRLLRNAAHHSGRTGP
jgi:2-octaprenyl-6-methoxyphenol hydroxylase